MGSVEALAQLEAARAQAEKALGDVKVQEALRDRASTDLAAALSLASESAGSPITSVEDLDAALASVTSEIEELTTQLNAALASVKAALSDAQT